MSVTLTAEARARLDAHLDAIEAALLQAGQPRQARRRVVDDVEAQALEMLARRRSGDAVSEEMMAEVLAGMDPAAAYGAGVVSINSAGLPAAEQFGDMREQREKYFRRRSRMRPAVAIAAIICGTVLVAWPEAMEYLENRNLVDLGLVPNGIPRVTPERQFGCWLTGSLAIASGVIGGFVAFAAERRQQSAV